MSILSIYFKWSLALQYNEMIELFSSLVVPVPSNAQGICTPSGTTGTTYANWGYAQINALILTSGQKYSIVPKSSGYVVLSLGYYTMGVSSYNSPGTVNYYYNGFNLNDYNNYVNNSNVKAYYFDTVGWNNLATAYAYTDTNGFTIDLTNLPSQYAIILGLLKFDFVNQFTTYKLTQAGTTYTYNVYGMSTALNNIFSFSGTNGLQLNTTTFLGIPVNSNIQASPSNPVIGYQFNYNFLVNDETVKNSAFYYPTDQGNVVGIPQNTSILIQSNSSYVSGASTLIEFGSPQNITYNSVVGLSTTYNIVTANGSSTASGLPNTNTIVDSTIGLPLPYLGGGMSLKSLYNNNGFNDVWVYSQNVPTCQPNSTTFYLFPPYFNAYNIASNNYVLTLNSTNPDIIYQYIAQAPVVQISTTTTQTVSASSSTTPTSTTITQTQTTTTSSTSSTTVTNITQQIVTALANPIVALILALALVGLAIFVLA